MSVFFFPEAERVPPAYTRYRLRLFPVTRPRFDPLRSSDGPGDTPKGQNLPRYLTPNALLPPEEEFGHPPSRSVVEP